MSIRKKLLRTPAAATSWSAENDARSLPSPIEGLGSMPIAMLNAHNFHISRVEIVNARLHILLTQGQKSISTESEPYLDQDLEQDVAQNFNPNSRRRSRRSLG
jgi:hypothetical protein